MMMMMKKKNSLKSVRRWLFVGSRLASSRSPIKNIRSSSYTGSFIGWKSVICSLLVGLPLAGTFFYLRNEYEKKKKKTVREAIGKMAIGGPFNLIDQDGNAKSDTDLKGAWLLLYFGFTHCPDVCPEQIEKMVDAAKNVKKRLLNDDDDDDVVKTIFISIDPERDTVDAVREYVRDFSDELIGLTGTVQNVSEVAKNYRVYFKSGPKDYENDYIVDHSIITYLIDPDGQFVDFYGKNVSTQTLTEAILTHVERYRQEKRRLIGSEKR